MAPDAGRPTHDQPQLIAQITCRWLRLLPLPIAVHFVLLALVRFDDFNALRNSRGAFGTWALVVSLGMV